jgi:hypothetical protein
VTGPGTWVATTADADDVARLLCDFNAEYDDPSPAPEWLAARLRQVMGAGDTAVMLIGACAIDGLAAMRSARGARMLLDLAEVTGLS